MFAQRTTTSDVSVPAAISSIFSILLCFCFYACLGWWYCRNQHAAQRRRPVIYVNSNPRSQRSQTANTVTVSGGNTVPPYAPTFGLPQQVPINQPLARLTGYSVDAPPPYSSLPPPYIVQQSAELVQQSEVHDQDQVEIRAQIQTQPHVVSNESEAQRLETSDSQDHELTLRPTVTESQEPPEPITVTEFEMQTDTIEFQGED